MNTSNPQSCSTRLFSKRDFKNQNLDPIRFDHPVLEVSGSRAPLTSGILVNNTSYCFFFVKIINNFH